MSWVRLDDRYFDNPKIAILSKDAKLAHLESITYCARELTDGFVPGGMAHRYAKPRVIKELVPWLWEPCRGGFKVHDYLEYNPTREQVTRARQTLSTVRSKAGRKGAAKRWQKGLQTDSPVSPIPEGDINIPFLSPSPDTHHPIPVPTRAVVVGFEQCFARLLSPTELELVRALEEEHPKERIEFALREAAALNKRSVRYVQRTCERVANDQSSGADFGQSGKAANPNGGTVGTPGMDERLAAQLQQRQHRTV